MKINRALNDSDSKQFRALLASEQDSAALYRGLAASATGERRMVFLELAAVEDRHAAHWAAKLDELGEQAPPPGRLTMRSRVLTWLAKQSSLDVVLPYIERAEHADAGLYDGHPHATSQMAADERAHARVLTRLREDHDGHADDATTRLPVLPRMPLRQPVPGRYQVPPTDRMRAIRYGEVAAPVRSAAPEDVSITDHEHWHRSDRSGALRAAVFGVNDGLVSNSSLVMGFAGSGAAGSTILFAGLAGLLAGAFSMAAGEYISMRSQKDAFEREIELEAAELNQDPAAEAEELALIYRAKGLDAGEAARVAATIMADREVALETMTREELGLDPDDLGSPWSAALSSLIAFAAGAAVVVLPFLFGGGTVPLVVAVTLAALSLFGVGAVLGVLNGRGAVRSGARQLAAGGAAGVVVFAVGNLIGAVT
ncbi:MAG TPA: VIT1/CCC1 transporter family protein [Pseudonocardiaceae bacterium]|nr:VIT1/CCC1 transporter family protein [Pseudonocardiaceae bacterium]